jgi:hypothetical protein
VNHFSVLVRLQKLFSQFPPTRFYENTEYPPPSQDILSLTQSTATLSREGCARWLPKQPAQSAVAKRSLEQPDPESRFVRLSGDEALDERLFGGTPNILLNVKI